MPSLQGSLTCPGIFHGKVQGVKQTSFFHVGYGTRHASYAAKMGARACRKYLLQNRAAGPCPTTLSGFGASGHQAVSVCAAPGEKSGACRHGRCNVGRQ